MDGLDYLTESPANAAVPLDRLHGRPLPQDQVYMRNSFPRPEPGEVTGEIEVVIPGRESWRLTPADLARLERVDLDMVLECAGNGRSLMSPVVEGLPWGLGGVSPIRVGGVRLAEALGDLPAELTEIVLTGFDRGSVHPQGEVNYQFSVPVRTVTDGTALLVTTMGGEPLGLEHGGPVRFMLPGHYAMKSVKWLIRIEGVTEPFQGHFVERYRYFEDDELEDGSPVAQIQVRSVIAGPGEGERAGSGPVTISGAAWSGGGTVERVALSIDGGDWVEAELTPGESPIAATSWSKTLDLGPGRHTVTARASDSGGHIQPLASRWNRNGYANNVAHTVSFEST